MKTKKIPGLSPMPGVELFFGLVSPSGSEVELVIDTLEKHLKTVGYTTVEIHISELIDSVTGNKASKLPFDARVEKLMTEGTRLRQEYEAPDICARLAIGAVRQVRQEKNIASGKTEEHPESIPVPQVAYIFRSLKTPEEVETLRIVYGRAFNLISIYASEEKRRQNLAKKIAKSKNDTNHQEFLPAAQKLINRDSDEHETYGQNVRSTFPKADIFVSLDSDDPSSLDSSIKRFVRLIFDDPFITPTKDEYGMFMAKAVALRSSDLGRQVGATILSENGDLMAAGCNEVPKFGGGQYWEGDLRDARDFQIGVDAAVEHRTSAVAEFFGRLANVGWLSEGAKEMQPAQLAIEMLEGEKRGEFAGVQILGFLEFGRAVHAEMAAITDASRRGVAIKGTALFSTTFPCHLCARHIISSGIKRVVYVEPYPKSKAHELYKDSVAVNPVTSVDDKVTFEPFVGVSPNRYLEFFQPNVERKNKKGKALIWEGNEVKTSRLKRYIYSYILMEETVIKELGEVH